MRIRAKDCRQLTNTQVWITNALLRLMEEKEYRKITIKEVTEEAELAMATFYLNFTSKDDVLSRYIEELFFLFSERTDTLDNPDAYSLALIYFSFWKEHLEFIRLLQAHELFALLLEKYEAWLTEISNRFGPMQIFHLHLSDENEKQYFLFCQSASLWNMLRHWVNNGTQEPPEAMAVLFQRVNGLRAD